MDGLSITKAVNILKKRYEGSRVTKITVTEDSVCVGVYSGDRASVLIRVTGGKPSVHTVFSQQGVNDQFLEKLNGGDIAEIGGRKYDRIIYFDIDKRKPSGKIVRHRLIFELIGKMANAMLVNEEGMVVWTFCKNNADADREMGIGNIYQMPKSNKKNTLDEYDREDFSDLLGFYPVTVKHAKGYLDKNYSFQEVVEIVTETLETEDKFYIDEAGKLIPFKPFEGGKEVEFDKIHELTDAKIEAKRDISIRKRLVRYFEKQAEKYIKLKDKLAKELESAEKYEEFSGMAELLKGNIYKLKDAKGTVELDRYTEEGVDKVAYDIPSGFEVGKEIEKLFRKSEKLKRSLPLLNSRIAEVDNNVDSALEQLYFIEISANDDELRELALEMKRKQTNQKRQVNQKQFEKVEIGEGIAYIGRNSVSNHRLVFQFANPSDWWFHAQKIPSAHLVFRKNGRVTEEEIAECAAIVAGLSKAKADLKVTVDYTQKKHVKKPKNTPPGFVIYHRFSSVIVEPAEIDSK